jgi:hypothetical protein
VQLEPDEPAAGPWRVVALDEFVRSLHRAAGTHPGRPRVIAVDGRGGAGKSTLVRRLTARVASSASVHTDDVAWHHAFFDWADLLAENVLEPLRRGEAVDHRPAAWAERGRPGSIVVPAGLDDVWVEGTGVIRTRLLPLLDASVWVQVDAADARERLLARDGDSPEQRRHVAEWDREERPFLREQRPWARATLVLAGSPVLAHDPGTQAVVAPAVT